MNAALVCCVVSPVPDDDTATPSQCYCKQKLARPPAPPRHLRRFPAALKLRTGAWLAAALTGAGCAAQARGLLSGVPFVAAHIYYLVLGKALLQGQGPAASTYDVRSVCLDCDFGWLV